MLQAHAQRERDRERERERERDRERQTDIVHNRLGALDQLRCVLRFYSQDAGPITRRARRLPSAHLCFLREMLCASSLLFRAPASSRERLKPRSWVRPIRNAQGAAAVNLGHVERFSAMVTCLKDCDATELRM